jgi:hypothetical protein
VLFDLILKKKRKKKRKKKIGSRNRLSIGKKKP